MPKATGIFYTYLWLRENGIPYYVGKGTTDRAYIDHRVGKAPSKDRIILQEYGSEEDAFFAEKFLIVLYGREDLGEGALLNMTDGGEGAVHSSEVLQRISETHKRLGIRPPSRKGCKASEETRRKQSISLQGHKGAVHTDESRRLQSERSKGNTYHKGFKHSEEALQKMRIAAQSRAPRERTARGTYV
jgi:hypothetical protein